MDEAEVCKSKGGLADGEEIMNWESDHKENFKYVYSMTCISFKTMTKCCPDYSVFQIGAMYSDALDCTGQGDCISKV